MMWSLNKAPKIHKIHDYVSMWLIGLVSGYTICGGCTKKFSSIRFIKCTCFVVLIEKETSE